MHTDNNATRPHKVNTHTNTHSAESAYADSATR
jgi:hypothetical protein